MKKSILKNLPLILKKENIKYQHDFVMFTCSFRRDLERCFNAYESFEKHTKEQMPYFICVPENDLMDFETLFKNKINTKQIKKIPVFITERWLMEVAGEPIDSALELPGYYRQDALRLAFGLTDIAKHYFMNDSDGYFTKEFDKNMLYRKNKLMFSFHETWHKPKTQNEMQAITDKFGHGHGNLEFINLGVSYFDIQKTVKVMLGNNTNKYRNYTCTPTCFDSSVVTQLKKQLEHVGVVSFSNAIRMIPFAFQWYGEFLDKIGLLIPMPFMFFTCESHVKVWKVKRDHFDDPMKIGIQYQSVDYSKKVGGEAHDRIRPVIEYYD